jgi:catechol 1,2-dioxygenase
MMALNAAVSDSKAHKFNPQFTQAVINATGPKATPRVRQLTTSLIQHLHDFARENELTVDEWMTGLELVCLPTLAPAIEVAADCK